MGPAMERTVLPSGLRVVTEHVPGVRSAAVGMWVGVGSRDEPAPLAGAAHYLEHLLFKGTARRTAAQIAEEIDAVGGELNAFTSREHTCYYAHVLDEDLGLAVDLVCDVLADARLDPADVDLERRVVLEEIAIRDDDPEDLLADEFSAALLGDHSLGRPVLGTAASVTGMGRDALHRFYRRRYTPERMVLAVAGDRTHGVTHEAVLDMVQRGFGHRLSAVTAPVPPRRGRARITGGRRLVVRTEDCEQAHLMLGVLALDRHDERRHVLGVLDAALGGGMSSRLFQQVREQRGLAYSVYGVSHAHADVPLLQLAAGLDSTKCIEAYTRMREIVSELRDDGPTEAEVSRARAYAAGRRVLAFENTNAVARYAAAQSIVFGEKIDPEAAIEALDAVTLDEVAEVARDVADTLAIACVGPHTEGDFT